MDFKTYISAIERKLSQMTEIQKTDWIYNQARIVEENQRKDFLDSLSGRKNNYTELMPGNILEWCNQIDSGEIYFETEEYEYYEEGAWESDWRTEYHDVFGIIPFLGEAINTCYQLLWQKEYDSTVQLLNRIFNLTFHTDCENDWSSEFADGLSIDDLASEGLFSGDFRKMSLCLLYACYQTNTGQDRIEKIYEYLKQKQCSAIVLTDVFAYGPEKITDEMDFMIKWRTFLMNAFGDRAAELLVDACIYIGGDDYLLETAEENVNNHPHLYKVCCERKYHCKEYEMCIEIAEEAVKQIDANKVIRADISDIAIKAAKEIEYENVAHFYKTAFYSNPNSWHLLRLFKLEDKNVLEEALKMVQTLEPVSFPQNTGSVENRKAAIYDRNQKMFYLFLLGDYKDIMKECQKNDSYLGWSSDIKGTIIPLLLLYLKKDEKQRTCAERNLIEQIKYRIQFESIENELFDEYLSIWRNSGIIPENEDNIYIQWLSREIDERTEHVVGGGHRKSYYKAAELIVVLGAIKEERGEINGMQNLVNYYKKQHSRKRAFREEIDTLAKKCL